jgi:hypothetical protein
MLSSQAPTLVRTWSAIVGLYGIAMTILLVIAWRAPSRKFSRVAAVASGGFVPLWIIGSFDYRMISGLEVIAATLVAVAASINWYAVHLVVRGAG